MSILNKDWQILNTSKKDLFEKLLENRGLTKEQEINEFLHPEDFTNFHDPYDFDDMKKTVKRIKEAIKNKERIIVFGDYDVDGITAATILIKTLQDLSANVSYRLPHRVKDGYGLKSKFIEEFAELGVKLVITVDCGISCEDEIKLAKKKGIDVIVTDHHTVPKNPPKAFSIIHPQLSNYKFKYLTGAGIAFKLSQALIDDAEKFLDLAAMGTIADIGILVGENRLIVKKGLQKLAKTSSMGLKFLKKIAGISDNNIDTHTIGFQIGPRINAAGRIDTPYFALQLLLNEDYERGEKLAHKLEELNKKRQDMMQKAFENAEKYFEEQKNKHIFIKEDKDWHVGILGLISGKITDKYGVPSIILQDFGESLTASARSTEHFDIIEALTQNSKYLIYFGGHARAAGFEISKDKYEDFKKSMEKYAEKKLKNINLRPSIKIECEIKDKDISRQTLDFIEDLKPFGEGNEKPKFLIRDLEIAAISGVGKEKSHLRIKAKTNGKNVDIIAFKFGQYINTLRGHKKIDVVCSLEKNEYKGRSTIQIKAVDFKTA